MPTPYVASVIIPCAALRAAVPELQAEDYEFVDIYPSDKNEPDDVDMWWLHVQRIEVHTVDSLFARNERLTEFAARHGLDSYDGMDVGLAQEAGNPS